MSQPSVASYFATRKRRASEELRNKSKVLILGDNDKIETLGLIPEDQQVKVDHALVKSKSKVETKKNMVVRNLQFDLSSKSKSASRTKPNKSKISSKNTETHQTDIRDTLLKVNKEMENEKNVIFEKLGCLSPKKSTISHSPQKSKINQQEKIQEPAYFKTPTKESSKVKDMSYDEIKNKVVTSSRLAELRAKIAQFKNCENKLAKLDQLSNKKKEESKKNDEKVKIKEFDRLHLEIPVSPQKSHQSPNKFFSPTKTIQLSPKASPARRLLFEPKEAPASPVKASPTKIPAYQKYQTLSEIGGKGLSLPVKYRLLAEMFRSLDTVSAMLYNRKEVITFTKVKPAIQELIRRNFTLAHLAQIKTIYPNAYNFHHEKIRSFGTFRPETYELVITPNIECSSEKSGRNTPDEDNILKSALETHMGPNVLLNRKRKFYNELLEIVKDEHDKFLQNLETPLNIPKDKITRWHAEFLIDNCRDIAKAEMPLLPSQEKLSTAKNVLERANEMFNDNSRMKKAIQLLADNQTKPVNMTNTNPGLSEASNEIPNLEVTIVDTPPATPKIQKSFINPALKGIPQSLLEKIRAKQAAKALEMMTRSTDANKDAIMYSRLPELAKIVRNIFVSEKKSVLTIEFVVKKLDDSYRTKLTTNELEKHVRLLCRLLPLWASIHVVRKTDYLKLAKDFDMVKVINRLEVLADEKV